MVPPEHAEKFHRFAASYFTAYANKCPEFLRHKSVIINPIQLERAGLPCCNAGIPVLKAVHRSGEFMITYPNGYHQGFNLGFNCAESVNFALSRWIEIGKKSKFCTCVGDSVRLDVAGLFSDPLLHLKPNVKRSLGGYKRNMFTGGNAVSQKIDSRIGPVVSLF